VRVHRDPAAVVDHRDGVVDVDGDADRVAEPGQGLVDGVVHHFIDEVVESRRAGRADVHGRALPHGLEPLEDLDLVGAVIGGGGIGSHGAFVVLGRRRLIYEPVPWWCVCIRVRQNLKSSSA
jgi:hypothetical protein